MAESKGLDEKSMPESPNLSSDNRRVSVSGDLAVENTDAPKQYGFWTRMGCTPESFKPRTLADKHNQLNQTLRSRHMHMIAIGKTLEKGVP